MQITRHRIALAGALLALLLPAEALGDESRPEVPKITFEQAIQRAIARNPEVEVAKADITRAEALMREARSGWLPSLVGNVQYTRLDADRVFANRVALAQNQLSANLQLTVPLVQGRAHADQSHARDQVDVKKLTAVDVKRQIALETGKAFIMAQTARAVLDSALRARDMARAHAEFSRSRFAGGVGNRIDAARAEQEQETNEANLEQQRIALARAQEALGVVVGESGRLDAGGDATLVAPPTLGAALDEATSRRSDVVAERRKVEAARVVARDSWVDYLPILSLVFQPFYQDPATITLPTTGWQAQAVLSLPLYDGGKRYAASDERHALHEGSKARLEGLLRAARSDVRLAFDEVRVADGALEHAHSAARLAREVLELAQLAYQVGSTSNLEVIDAERRARDAESAVAVAEGKARQARLELLAACGRFP